MTTPVWVKVVALLGAICGGVLALPMALAGAALIDGVTVAHSYTLNAELAASATVSVDVSSGAIKVLTGPEGQVSVRERDTVRALTRRLAEIELDTLHTSLTPSSSGVSIETRSEPFVNFATFRVRQVTVDMPAGANLRVTAAAAEVVVTGIHGDIALESASGAVRLRGMDVTGQTSVQVVSGDIEFDGAIHGGHLDLRAVSGAVRASIPKTTDAHFDASTTAGAIIIDRGFPLPVLTREGPGQSASGDLGSGGPATITMTTISGVIYLKVR